MDELEKGMVDAARAHGSPVLAELEAINARYALALQKDKEAAKPPQAEEPYSGPGGAALALAVAVAKPAMVLAAAGAVAYVAVSAAAMAVGAMMAFVSANFMWIGGGLFAVVCVWLGVAGANGGKDGGATNNGKNEYHYHYHQNNNFGGGNSNNTNFNGKQ